ncbi:cytosine-specific methyltransferase, partial [Haematococcus lacustris]
VRLLLHGSQTVLGDVASDSELFVTEEVVVRPLAEVAGLCHAQLLQRPWVWSQRQQHFRDDEALRKANDERREAGQPLHYIYRSYYQPSQGMFCALPPGLLDVSKGDYVEDPSKPISLGLLPGGAGFIKAGLLQRPWVWAQRQQHFRDDEALRKANDERREAGQPLHYIYRSYYQPSQGMFCALPPGLLDVSKGAYVEDPSKPISLGLLPGGAGFIKAGVEYRIGDVMYLHPQTFDEDLVPGKAIKKEGGPKASKAKKGRAQRKA